jgi:hypothetical protein
VSLSRSGGHLAVSSPSSDLGGKNAGAVTVNKFNLHSWRGGGGLEW